METVGLVATGALAGIEPLQTLLRVSPLDQKRTLSRSPYPARGKPMYGYVEVLRDGGRPHSRLMKSFQTARVRS